MYEMAENKSQAENLGEIPAGIVQGNVRRCNRPGEISEVMAVGTFPGKWPRKS